MNSELEIQDAVVDYFRRQEMICFPDKSLNWKAKFSIHDIDTTPVQNREPDVVAYKWKNDGISLDVRAVECKLSGTYSSVKSAVEQAELYQEHVPWCYVATETSSLNLDFLTSEHLGYLPVTNHSVEKGKISDCYDALLNTRLDSKSYVLTRQKLVAFDSFLQMFGQSIQFAFDGDNVFASTRDRVQNHITNYFHGSDFCFGINVEKQPAVKASLLGRMSEIQKLISSSEWNDHFISFGIREYEMQNRRMDMKVLEKPCRTFNPADAGKIERIMTDYNYQVVFLILKKVWNKDELLSREEHREKLQKELLLTDELRKKMGWVRNHNDVSNDKSLVLNRKV